MQKMLRTLAYFSTDEMTFKTVLDMFVNICRIANDEDVDFDELQLGCIEQGVLSELIELA